jgi:hypothetical protein
MLVWTVALVALEVGGVVWAIDVVSGLDGCQLINLPFFLFRNVTYTSPSLWKVIHGFEFVVF